MVCQINDALFVLAGKPDHRKRPFYNACLDIFKSFYRKFFNDRCLFHSKSIVTALEMVVAENGSAYDWKICIGAQEVMRKCLYKIKQFHKSCPLDLHRCMLTVENDTVLIVIHIWRILKSPSAAVHGQRDDTVVLSGRMIGASCIPLIFYAKQALWISRLLGILGCRDRLRILFRLGKIDGDIQGAVLSIHSPFLIFLYTVTADIVAVLAEFKEIVCGCLR